MKHLFAFLLLLFCQGAIGQFNLLGVVKDADTKQPVAGVSIFITNSKIGTTSAGDGTFTLAVPEGRYDLVFSAVNYETQVISIDEKTARPLQVFFKPKAKELESVTVTSYEKNGWQDWGQFFLDNFIGTMANAKDCKLKNREAVRFRRNIAENSIEAVAFEPLVVENKALGYVLKYQLEEFNYNFKTHIFYYEGYPLFIEMEGSDKQKQKWEKKRQQVYYGSIQHFMRALFRNKLVEEGYEVRKLVKKENMEKKRVKQVYADRFKNRTPGSIITIDGGDSSNYYNNILSQSDYMDFLYKPVLPGDSIAYAINTTTAGVYFTDYLDIAYIRAKAPPEYVEKFPKLTDQISQITLTEPVEIAVWANGSHSNARSILSSGYWAWSEKAGNLLPIDYWPRK